ncbi:hypothetical protein BH11PLA2_BH11PLA2_30010 [soil metagenome]
MLRELRASNDVINEAILFQGDETNNQQPLTIRDIYQDLASRMSAMNMKLTVALRILGLDSKAGIENCTVKPFGLLKPLAQPIMNFGDP